jgi:crossover junction endodeoxyribonuclease RusA
VIRFFVPGIPAPKQSFRFSRNGHYQSLRVKSWQAAVASEAQKAYSGKILEAGLSVTLVFSLPDRRRRDLDNLSKGVLDALNGLIFKDDTQICALHLFKLIRKQEPGAFVEISTLQGDLNDSINYHVPTRSKL